MLLLNLFFVLQPQCLYASNACCLFPSRLTCVLWTSITTSLNCQRSCPSFPTSSSSFRRSQRCSCPSACLWRETFTPATASPSTGASDPSIWSLTSAMAIWPRRSTPTCWGRMKLSPDCRRWSRGRVWAWRRWDVMSSHELKMGCTKDHVSYCPRIVLRFYCRYETLYMTEDSWLHHDWSFQL